jgi:hypothetical protein
MNQNQTESKPPIVKEPREEGLDATTCYALRLYTYDYYEWQEDFAVSFDPELLKNHFAELDHLYDEKPLVDVSEHKTHSEREDVHWVITPILFLHNTQAQARQALPDAGCLEQPTNEIK